MKTWEEGVARVRRGLDSLFLDGGIGEAWKVEKGRLVGADCVGKEAGGGDGEEGFGGSCWGRGEEGKAEKGVGRGRRAGAGVKVNLWKGWRG